MMAREPAIGAQVKLTSILGSSESQISSSDVRGGRVFVLFGSGKINLGQATLSNGAANINVVAIFGGAKVIVPESWEVNVQTGAVLGDVEYKRTAPPSPTDHLTLTGFCLFGGVEVSS